MTRHVHDLLVWSRKVVNDIYYKSQSEQLFWAYPTKLHYVTRDLDHGVTTILIIPEY